MLASLLLALEQSHQSAKIDPPVDAGCVHIKPLKGLLFGPSTKEALESRVDVSESQKQTKKRLF